MLVAKGAALETITRSLSRHWPSTSAGESVIRVRMVGTAKAFDEGYCWAFHATSSSSK
ncbi:unannotated protein [freshwater metagenome]|uniref:Unannotated protein n=1 Tax=freshwater metagenome TaxID=449393 RepID=A0A6J7K141_9ZZZZ